MCKYKKINVITLVVFLLNQASLEKKSSIDHSDLQSKLEKLDLIEREYLKLTATQTAAEVNGLFITFIF